ncbi:MAG: FimV/HubP family polar landmark protein, partial [Dokdonella sp.]
DMAGDDVPAGDDNVYRFDEDDLAMSRGDAPRYDFDEPVPVPPPNNPYATATMPAVAFDFDADKPKSASAADSAFSFDLPPIEPAETPRIVTEYDLEPEPPASTIDDDEFFAGDDAIGTKLDLAKAYLDMGDPDGARAMLEEVLAEGNALQQDEARKLIGEIH